MEQQGFPMIEYRLEDEAQGYRNLNARRLQRAMLIASDTYLGVPITPIAPNPVTGRHSYHIVRVFTLDPRYAVDLFFLDENVYWIAFRRVIDLEVGVWIKFKKVIMPGGIHAVEIGLSSSHESAAVSTLGDIYALNASLLELITYQANMVPGVVPGLPMIRAKARVILTFSEGLRFLCVETEAAERMEGNIGPGMIPNHIWNRMQTWQIVCDVVLELRRTAALAEDHPLRVRLQNRLNIILARYNYANLEAIVGPGGDFRLILRREKLLILPAALVAAAAQPGANFPEPGFPAIPNP